MIRRMCICFMMRPKCKLPVPFQAAPQTHDSAFELKRKRIIAHKRSCYKKCGNRFHYKSVQFNTETNEHLLNCTGLCPQDTETENLCRS